MEEGRSGGGYSQSDEGLFQDRFLAGFASVRGLAQVNMRTKSVKVKALFSQALSSSCSNQCHNSKYLFNNIPQFYQ